MVLSQYIFSLPYTLLWHIAKLFSKELPVVFYCRDIIDWFVFQPVKDHLPDIKIVSDKGKTISQLRRMGVNVKSLPVFPQAVIMCRHSTHKFPCKGILKIGMRHGPYHFKRFTKASNYNQFDMYLFSSRSDLEAAKKTGVTIGKAAGYPKLDPALNGTYNASYLTELSNKAGLDKTKSTILFTATWYKSEMSAILEWYDRLGELVKFYNVIVTLHPWMDRKFVRRIRKTAGVLLLRETDNVIPYIMLSDVCIGDTSSIIAECCALDKPVITFNIGLGPRSVPETEKIIENISYQINCFPQLILAIEYALKNRSELAKQRAQANLTFFDELDGKASLRVAQEITKLLSQS